MRNYKLANIGLGLSDPTILTMAGRETECSCNNAYNDGAGRQHAYITARDLRITVSGEKYESTPHRHASDVTVQHKQKKHADNSSYQPVNVLRA